MTLRFPRHTRPFCAQSDQFMGIDWACSRGALSLGEDAFRRSTNGAMDGKRITGTPASVLRFKSVCLLFSYQLGTKFNLGRDHLQPSTSTGGG